MNIRKLAFAGTVAAAALAASSPAMALTIFSNDFESGGYAGTGFAVRGSFEGWTATAGAGIEVQYGNVAGASNSGVQHVELDSHNNSAMSRFIDDGLYTLSFYYSDRPGVAAASNGIDVLVNGVSVLNFAGGLGGGGTVWGLKTINFSAASGVNTLTFAARGTSDSLGGYIDDVSLSGAVPEPATWAMMIVGLGVVGISMRRRKVAVSFA